MTTPQSDERGWVQGTAPKDRRRSSRVKISPNEIVYMNFQSGNGGIVVDVSSIGLGFQAATPIEGGESLSFRLSPSAVQHIELSGQVVWLDDTRKRGGLRLNDLPVEVRSEIQLWRRKYLSLGPEIEPASKKEANLSPPNAISAGRGSSLPVWEHASKAPMQAQGFPAAARPPVASDVGPGQGANAPTASPGDSSPTLKAHMYAAEWNYSALSGPMESRTGRYVFTVALLLGLLIVVVGGFVLRNRQRAGEFLIRLGKSISAEQSSASAQAPAAVGESTGTDSTTSGSSSETVDNAAQNPEAMGGPAQTSTPEQPQSAVDEAHKALGTGGADREAGAQVTPPLNARSVQQSTERGERASAPGDNGGSELARARSYLQSKGSEDAAAQLLWVAVGKGNSDAEVELAGLYLTGQGAVRKNCQQARILLVAAEKNHHSEAAQWLARLPDYGCR